MRLKLLLPFEFICILILCCQLSFCPTSHRPLSLCLFLSFFSCVSFICKILFFVTGPKQRLRPGEMYLEVRTSSIENKQSTTNKQSNKKKTPKYQKCRKTPHHHFQFLIFFFRFFFSFLWISFWFFFLLSSLFFFWNKQILWGVGQFHHRQWNGAAPNQASLSAKTPETKPNPPEKPPKKRIPINNGWFRTLLTLMLELSCRWVPLSVIGFFTRQLNYFRSLFMCFFPFFFSFFVFICFCFWFSSLHFFFFWLCCAFSWVIPALRIPFHKTLHTRQSCRLGYYWIIP